MNILYKVANYNTESGYQLVNTVTGICKTLAKVEYQTRKDVVNDSFFVINLQSQIELI